MRVLPIIIVGLVFASAAFMVQPVQAQPLSILEGQVCGESKWEGEGCHFAIPDATVRLTGGPAGAPLVDETTTTDEDGRFAFSNVVQGDYTVAVSRTGFLAASESVTAPSSELTFILQPQRIVVEGTITDAAGDRVAGARVYFYGPDYASPRTDADGNFLTELMAGTYEMEIDGGKSGYLQQTVFVDGTRLDAQLGALEDQDAVVKGRVVDQHGDPVKGVDVMIDQWERRDGEEYVYGNYRNWTTTDGNGNYQADVYAGSFSINFAKDGYANIYRWQEVASGKTANINVEMAKYPEKTAVLAGKVTDGKGNGLSPVSISIQHPEYGLYSCSMDHSYAYAKPMAEPAEPDYAGDEEGAYYYEESYYYDPGCDITVHEDGSFTGNVTPGYAIISVWFDHWSSCRDSGSSDGSYSRDCGPDYFGYTQTLNLEADAENPITITLRERPGSDATISGYAVDTESNTAVKNAYVSFNNQETYAWGNAETDKDGSYKVAVRHGYHQIHVWADGYLPWQGVVYIPKGADFAFDIPLTAGETQYGGCCYGHHGGIAYADDGMEAPASGEPRAEPMPMEGYDMGGMSSGGSGEGYDDLGGGLGPYNAEARQQQLQSASGKQSPVPLALVVVALGLVALRRRF